MKIINNKNIFKKIIVLFMIFSGLFFFTSCSEELKKMLKVTNVEREKFVPKCKKSMKGKNIYVDFDTTTEWYYSYASGLSAQIRDQLTDDFVNDKCFQVQDYGSGYTGTNFDYRVHVVVARPVVKAQQGVIRDISATFRIKIYNRSNRLVKAQTKDVKYKAPILVITVNDSQSELLENYAYNVSVEIRKSIYQSIK